MSNDLWSLSGRKALITGATNGMGKAIAEAFLKKGPEVFISARNKENIDELVSEWRGNGYVAFGFACDLTDVQQRVSLISAVQEQWGVLDILVNNVGPNFKKSFFDYTLDEYQSLVEGNMTSAFHTTQLCLPLLRASNNASIINISGISSQVTFKGSGPYGMAKAGLESFTRTLAVELGGESIRANAILPGFTATETFLKKYDDAYLSRALAQIPLKRMGNSQDVANLACFLAMPVSEYMTGQCVTIDGGFSIYGFGGPTNHE